MALVLYLEQRKSGAKADFIFRQMEQGNGTIYIPAIALAEIGYLFERHRITCSLSDVRHLIDTYSDIRIHPLTLDVVESSFSILDIPELHDRLIAGTARLLQASLITNDPVIIASASVTTIW